MYLDPTGLSAFVSIRLTVSVPRGETVWGARRLSRKLARVAVGIGPAVEPQLREAPVMSEGSCVGLDVHARSVVAGVIDGVSGEVRSLRVPPGCDATVGWLETLAAPVRVVPADSTDAGTRSRPEASPARSSWSPSHASSPDTAGHSRRWSSPTTNRFGEESAPAQRREERPERTL